MKNKDFTTSFITAANAEAVFEAVSNPRKWWSENIDGVTDKLNAEFDYHYMDVHRSKMKIIEFIPNKKQVWFVEDNYFNFTKNPTEWKATTIVFDISTEGGKTKLNFTHIGLVPEEECYKICQDAWTHYIQGSLKNLIETGKGEPTPKGEGEQDEAAAKNSDINVAKTICHRFLIEKPVETVYKAITTREGLSGWWTPETIAEPQVGTIARFGFGPDYFKEMEIVKLRPYCEVQWVCLKAAEEWVGTKLSFDLQPHRKGTVLFFRHEGWKAYSDEFASCSFDWALFFRSLRFFCETGRGFPYPDYQK